MRIVTSREMRDLDQEAMVKYHIPSIVLMENAGSRSADMIIDVHNKMGWNTEIIVLAGKGKNGGDALVTARHLVAKGKRIRLFLLHNFEDYHPESKQNLKILLEQKIEPIIIDNVGPLEEYFTNAYGPYFAIDGLLGIGFKGPLAGLYADVVDLVNEHVDFCVSLDIPTGVDATTGAVVGQAIKADLTICYGFPKLGLYIPPGASYRGELAVVDISLPPHYRKEGKFHSLHEARVAKLLTTRDQYGHKNSFGHTLLVGGSPNRIGAICMAASASLHVGTGLVSVATWEDCFELFVTKAHDEIMSMPITVEGAAYKKFLDDLKNYSSIVVGPGMGTGEAAARVLRDLITYYNGPLVIDADGINLLAKPELRDLLLTRRAPSILTPHPGEISRMLGVNKDAVVRDPVKFIENAVEVTNAVVLLKGATTFICSGDGKVYLNHYPNDGMATAGSGDVLAGILGGLVGQGMIALDAVCLGVYIHSLSGDFAAKQLGHRAMTASDIVSHLGDAFLRLRNIHENKFHVDTKSFIGG